MNWRKGIACSGAGKILPEPEQGGNVVLLQKRVEDGEGLVHCGHLPVEL